MDAGDDARLPGVGHLFPIQHWDEVLAGLR